MVDGRRIAQYAKTFLCIFSNHIGGADGISEYCDSEVVIFMMWHRATEQLCNIIILSASSIWKKVYENVIIKLNKVLWY